MPAQPTLSQASPAECPSGPLSAADLSRIIEMAWEDRTPFEALKMQFGLNESAVIKLMRKQLKRSSYQLWRARVQGRATKHAARRPQALKLCARGFPKSQDDMICKRRQA